MTHVLQTIKEKGSKNGKNCAVLQPSNPCFLNFSIIHWKLKEISKNSTENIMFFYFSATKSFLCIKLKTVPQSSILYHCFSDY
jgi:hypothetical protein